VFPSLSLVSFFTKTLLFLEYTYCVRISQCAELPGGIVFFSILNFVFVSVSTHIEYAHLNTNSYRETINIRNQAGLKISAA